MFRDAMFWGVVFFGGYLAFDWWTLYNARRRERESLLDNPSAKRIQSSLTTWE